MPDVGTWAKLAAYVVCIGLVLEFAHRIYWQMNRWVIALELGATLRAVLCTLCASIPLIAVLAVTGVFCIYVDNQSLESLGLQQDVDSLLHFAGGLTVAIVAVSFVFLAGYSIGWFRVENSSFSRSRVPEFCGGASDFLLAAIFEEVAVRGYILSVLLHTWGPSVAIVGSSIIFSFFHLIKHPRLPVIFTINAFLFGVITAQARLVTGTLWAPIGLHFGWNLAMGPIYGLPCSGREYNDGLVCCSVDGPEWVTGGLYSPDAGILGTATLIVATAALTTFLPIY